MMEKTVNWIKSNKLASFLILVVLYFVYNFATSVVGIDLLGDASYRKAAPGYQANEYFGSAPAFDVGMTGGVMEDDMEPSVELERTATATEGRERIVIQNSNLSLVVKDVRKVGDEIIDFAEERGGYMVTASYNQPEESPFATITARVPTKDFGEALGYFRSLSIKVVSESLIGRDVTEQYVDIEERISTLTKTKSKFEAILDQATRIDDILRVQREIINLQNQIDSYKGRLKAIREEAELTKMIVYLSTDELSLPYAPDNKFRPSVIFKLAVRSLLSTLTGLGEAAIWVGVYSVVWGPVLVIYLGYNRWKKNKSKQTSPGKSPELN